MMLRKGMAAKTHPTRLKNCHLVIPEVDEVAVSVGSKLRMKKAAILRKR